jgi:hypothetical protein
MGGVLQQVYQQGASARDRPVSRGMIEAQPELVIKSFAAKKLVNFCNNDGKIRSHKKMGHLWLKPSMVEVRRVSLIWLAC